MINAANSDNAFVVHALLDGLKGSGKTLIQTSGSSVVGAYDNGEASEDTFDEDTPFTPQPEKAMRVAIDNQVLAAAKDNVRTIVIRPTLIYGRGIGVAATSVQLPRLIDVAKKHGVPRHVGRGLNIWGHVHIADVVVALSAGARQGEAPARCSTRRTARRIFKSVTQSIGRMLGLGDKTQDWPIGEAVEALGPGAYLELRLEQPRAREALARARLAADRAARCSTRSRTGFTRRCMGRSRSAAVARRLPRRNTLLEARTTRRQRRPP